MREYIFLVSFFCISLVCAGQIGENTQWRFIKGDTSVADIVPRFGEQGIITEGNKPGARNGSAEWTDANGNLWLFGGYGTGADDMGLLNDLWKYDRVLNQWVFIKGDNIKDVKGLYGVQGAASDENKPGSRSGSSSWIDASGNLWLFGGSGYYTGGSGKLNDLWKYDPGTNQWTWIKGDNSKDVPGSYSAQGVSDPGNNPGGRDKAVSWIDESGKLWLFGGDGPEDLISFSDLWKYDPDTNEWTWINGSNITNLPGMYGNPLAANNKPGARGKGVTWSDNSGNLWLFGGYGYYPAGQGWFNDLWRYNVAGNQWTWVKGDSGNVSFQYGTIGISDINNKPGAREWSKSWKDSGGNFWLFGGYGFAVSGFGFLNDLWRYEPASNKWTWMKGSDSVDKAAVFGIKSVAQSVNRPGSVSAAISWADNSDNFWLFGGYGHNTDVNNTGLLNDLWKYDVSDNQWAWMKGDSIYNMNGIYGVAGSVAEGNKPGARESSVTWKDDAGNLWLYGGFLQGNYGNAVFSDAYFNDLWKYDISFNQWIWIKGDNMSNVAGVYGTRTQASAANNPGSRSGSVSWKDQSGKFWLFGGMGYDADGIKDLLSDLWKYDLITNQWTWMKGDSLSNATGNYGTGATSKPGARRGSVSWIDVSGNLWLFGGEGYDKNGNYGHLNDLWKYNISSNQWSWINGADVINTPGLYGHLNVANNKPGARIGSVSWIDNTGSLLLFGGFGYYHEGPGWFNDMWKYSITSNQWTWIRGDSADVSFEYGTQGTFSPGNKPGARANSDSWTDNSGSLWLFGGTGIAEDGFGFLNDLWKYDPNINQWAWMKGDKIVDVIGSPGVKGIPSGTNKPMAKEKMVSWADNSGNLWMYGGTGKTFWGNIDDLWKYTIATNQWTWMKGETSFSVTGRFGTRGISGSENIPGAREYPVSWTDSSGKLWLFGGGIVYQQSDLQTNDLWKYDPLINQWTWMKGDSLPDAHGLYSGQSQLNTPGARKGSVSWIDNSGNLWLFGGENFDRIVFDLQTDTVFNDLWKYNPQINQWTWMKGDSIGMGPGMYLNSNLDAIKPGARTGSVGWKDNDGNLWLFGGWAYTNGSYNYNDLWKYTISTNRWTWMKGDSLPNSLGSYGNLHNAAITNNPPPRQQGAVWTDSNGNFWLFGGNHLDGGFGSATYNDLWKYNPASNNWTWMNGSDQMNMTGYYILQGVPDDVNSPGARGGSFSWKDVYGNIFIFGGFGYSTWGGGWLNDLWRFDCLSNQWTFLSSDDLYAQGTVSRPGARYLGASWSDPYGDLWLYGGFGIGTSGLGFLNDLWKISAAATFVFIGDGNWGTATNWVNGAVPPTTISAGMNVTIDHLLPGQCVRQGAITVLPFGRLKVESGKRLTINQGDLANAGSIEGPGNRPGKLLFTGADTSLLQSIGDISTPIILDSKQMELSANTVTDSITLTGGSKLKLNNYNLNIGSATLKGDSTNFIVTNGTGRLIRTVADSPVTFDIGINDTSYSPVTITNEGVPDNFNVRVMAGVFDSLDNPITSGNVNRTWLVADALEGGSNVKLKMQWKESDEQSVGFNRNQSYISRLKVCPLPRNCSGSIYDLGEIRAASDLGQGYYSMERSGIDSFRTNSFIVTSTPFVFKFTGSGEWTDPLNWTPGIPAPYVIEPGMEVIIDPQSPPLGTGECIIRNNILITQPGKLTVRPGKKLTVMLP